MIDRLTHPCKANQPIPKKVEIGLYCLEAHISHNYSFKLARSSTEKVNVTYI